MLSNKCLVILALLLVVYVIEDTRAEEAESPQWSMPNINEWVQGLVNQMPAPINGFAKEAQNWINNIGFGKTK